MNKIILNFYEAKAEIVKNAKGDVAWQRKCIQQVS